MSFKIPCGGFKLDEKSFSLDENGVLSVSGGGVQPDWNQNDETASDYIKNRPFYTGDPVETVLVEESTVSFSGDGGFYSGTVQSSFKPKLGNTYKVFWDGSIYESLCTPAYEDFMIGNTSIMGIGADTGEPFLISIYKDTDTIEIITTETSESHTISISESSQLIVKIPAKFIDKNTSGYIVVHKSETMTKQEAVNYTSAFSGGEIALMIWGATLHIKTIYYVSGSTLSLVLENNESYEITENNEGVFNYNDRILTAASFPANYTSTNKALQIHCEKDNISISPYSYSNGVGSTNALFTVKPNGTKSKNFDVLGNGEAVAPAIILYSTTANSTKKFRVTVDDSGNLTATEI